MTQIAPPPPPSNNWQPPTSGRVATPGARGHGSDMPALLMMFPVRIFLAIGWFRAGVEKVIDASWWNGDGLRTYLDEQHGAALPFMRPTMESVIRPAAVPVAATVAVLQIAMAIAIVSGVRLTAALRVAVALNVVFILTGSVNPSCFYLVMEVALLFAIAAHLIGRPSIHAWRPSRWGAAAWFTASFIFMPFVKTLEPAHVVEDPALMLSFLCLLVAAGLLLARAHAHEQPPLWAEHVVAWSRADARDRRGPPTEHTKRTQGLPPARRVE